MTRPHLPCMINPLVADDGDASTQSSWGQHGAHLGPVGPRWAPCWPHEPCCQGSLILLPVGFSRLMVRCLITKWMEYLIYIVLTPTYILPKCHDLMSLSFILEIIPLNVTCKVLPKVTCKLKHSCLHSDIWYCLTHPPPSTPRIQFNYPQTSDIGHILLGNKIVDHSDVAGALPVGTAPTTSLFST